MSSRSRFNCVLAVFSAFAEDLGMDRQNDLKISCAFGSSTGRPAGTCGAVSGALMRMLPGLKYGKYQANDKAQKGKTYILVQEFTRRFKSSNRSILYRELHHCDMDTPEGIKIAVKKTRVPDVGPRI